MYIRLPWRFLFVSPIGAEIAYLRDRRFNDPVSIQRMEWWVYPPIFCPCPSHTDNFCNKWQATSSQSLEWEKESHKSLETWIKTTISTCNGQKRWDLTLHKKNQAAETAPFGEPKVAFQGEHRWLGEFSSSPQKGVKHRVKYERWLKSCNLLTNYCTCFFFLGVLKVHLPWKFGGWNPVGGPSKNGTQILPRSMILFDVFLYAEKRCALRHEKLSLSSKWVNILHTTGGELWRGHVLGSVGWVAFILEVRKQRWDLRANQDSGLTIRKKKKQNTKHLWRFRFYFLRVHQFYVLYIEYHHHFFGGWG